jgi:hypothetical protein
VGFKEFCTLIEMKLNRINEETGKEMNRQKPDVWEIERNEL